MRWLVLVVGVGTVAFGVAGLFLPDRIAGIIGFGLESGAARGEMRAVYGGLFLALGLVIAVPVFRPRHRVWWLVSGLVFAGLVAGRIVSLLTDGIHGYTLITGASEGLAAAVLLFAALRRAES